MWLLSTLAFASPAPSRSLPESCAASMRVPHEDPSVWIARVRAECASLVRDRSCRQAIETPGVPIREACLPLLPPELADRVKKALAADPSEKIVHLGELQTDLLRSKPEQALIAMLLVAEAPVVVPVPPAPAPVPPAHALSVLLSLDRTEVLADGALVPCPDGCLEASALRQVLQEVGARPGWEGVDSLVIYADAEVPYARVVAVLDAAHGLFPNVSFAVAPP